MALKIDNTHGWARERLFPMWPSILANLRKFVAQMSDDITEEFVIETIMSGRHTLWVIYEEDRPDVAVLCILTEVKKNDATGRIFIEVTGMGGNRVHECLPLGQVIEDWGMENHGATEMMMIGRIGWRKVMKQHGYNETAVIMKKKLEGFRHGRQQQQQSISE